jgi:hypothetical protein
MLHGSPQPQEVPSSALNPPLSQQRHSAAQLSTQVLSRVSFVLQVDGNDVAWVPSASGGPFKRVDTRSFMVSTTDLMSFYYVTLPKGVRFGGWRGGGALA